MSVCLPACLPGCPLQCRLCLQQKFKGMQQMAPQLTKAQMKLPQTKREACSCCTYNTACVVSSH
jgi:hypothetical protein